jgi:hypothetical protein
MPQERDDSSHDDGGITRQEKKRNNRNQNVHGVLWQTFWANRHYRPLRRVGGRHDVCGPSVESRVESKARDWRFVVRMVRDVVLERQAN